MTWIKEIKCPACGFNNTLFVDLEGHITCSLEKCPNPDYPEAVKQSNKAYLLSVLPEKWATPSRRDYETDRQLGYNEAIETIKKNAGIA